MNDHFRFSGENGELTVKCVACKRFFTDKNKMEEHVDEVHKSDLTCEICNKYFYNAKAKKCHIRFHHGKKIKRAPYKKQQHICTKCGNQVDSN